MGNYLKDAFERVLWTAVAAGLSAAGVYVADLPAEWIPVGTVILTMFKVMVAKKVGNPDNASMRKE